MCDEQFYFRFPLFAVLVAPREAASGGIVIDGALYVAGGGIKALVLLTDINLAEKARGMCGSSSAKVCKLPRPEALIHVLDGIVRAGATHVVFDQFSPGQSMKAMPIATLEKQLQRLSWRKSATFF